MSRFVKYAVSHLLQGIWFRTQIKGQALVEANVHKVRAVVDGEVKRIRVCAKCLKAGKVTEPSSHNALFALSY